MGLLGSRPIHWLYLAGFVVVIFVFQLGTRGLNEPDEGRYANIALETLEMDHPWWEPQMADVGHYDKPPLTYWVSALGYEIFGVNEWGARLPSLLGGLMTVAGVGWLAWRRYGARLAWLAVLMAATLVQIWLWARLLSCDMLLAGWCTLAIAAWAETRHRGGRYGWWLLQVLFWSLAGWTKSIPLLIPMLGLAIFVYAAGDAEDRCALKLPLLLPLVILCSIPWYVLVLAKHPDLHNFFFHREVAQRLTGKIAGRAGHLYYYVPLCLVFWLPWWPLAVAAFVRQRADFHLRLARWREHLSPGLCLVLTGFIVFSLIGSKHPTYLLPFAPWAALEMARLLARDRVLGQSSVVLSVAAVAAFLYVGAISLIPARESKLGVHSSLRDVAVVLRERHVSGVYSDHFWPSLEVYWGEKTHFIDNAPREIVDRIDQPDLHFSQDVPAHDDNIWFVHLRKDNNPTFNRWLNDPQVPKIMVGDFVIGPLEEGALTAGAMTPARATAALGARKAAPHAVH